jgi:xanthosine utilization system XapX-like protein
MKKGLIGGFAGLLVGLVIGMALFGPIGGAVGGVLGLILGFLIVTPVAVLSARAIAQEPFYVECPETHRMVEVTLDPDKACRAELWNKRQRILTCSRVEGQPHCHEGCVGQLEI